MFTKILNMFIDGLVDAVNLAVSILPNSPFRDAIQSIQSRIGSEMLGYLNYFVPISEMVSILAVWVTSIMIYYLVSIIMRWAKVIS